MALSKLIVGVALLSLFCANGLSIDKLTTDNASETVGVSKFEATLMALARLGKFDLFFKRAELTNMLSLMHPFSLYNEAKENVVLMDEFPYVPYVEVPEHNSTFVLSNLVVQQNFNPILAQVQLKPGWQSLLFVDIPMNATFDWRLNGTDIAGQLVIQIPHAWLHQNVELACNRELLSLLSWEGRADLYMQDIDIITAYTEKPLIDKFALAVHSSKIVKKYVANALQHQVARFLGDAHWQLQARMRDLCLSCGTVKNNNETLAVLLKADIKCMNGVPEFFWKSVADDNLTPKDAQNVAAKAITALLTKAKYKEQHAKALEIQSLQSVNASTLAHPRENLTPKTDPRAKWRKAHRPGFVEDPVQVPAWRQTLGKWFMRWNLAANATANSTTPNQTKP